MTGFPAWALSRLCCPHCGGALQDAAPRDDPNPGAAADGEPRDPVIVGCRVGHRFDVARQGYLPLLGPRSRTDTGDSPEMVRAREEFLSGGWYEPIAAAVGAAIAQAAPGVAGPVVEIGAGTGYYLAAALARSGGRQGLALDSSRHAVRRAARLRRVAAILADGWSTLPLPDGVAAAVLSIFAPRNPAELTRILAPDGCIVVVSPHVDHLAELRPTLGLLCVEAGKADRVAQAFTAPPSGTSDGARMGVLRIQPVRYPVRLPPAAVLALVAMGPTARHVSADALAAAVAQLPDPVGVTVAVTVMTLKRVR